MTVQDNGTTTEVSTQTGKTVSDALDAAKVKVGEKDKVDPALDTKLDDKTTKIVVERYAKVKVVKGSESKDVELYGGTVADALKAAGVELSANDTTDVDASAYVKDGMTVNVFTTKKVKVSVDGGEATEVSTKVATVGDVLAEKGIKLAEGDEVNPSAGTALTDGMEITVTTAAHKQAQADVAAAEADAAAAAAQADHGEVAQDAGDAGGVYEVSRTAVPNCADGSHGYYEINYSDGTVAYEEY